MSAYPYHNGTNGRAPERSDARGADTVGAPSDQLRSLLAAFWKHKWVFLVILTLVIGGTWYYTTTLPRTYQTSTLLLVTKGTESPASLQFRGSMGNRGLERRSLANEMLVLQRSRTIAERVATKLIETDRHPSTGRPLQIIRGGAGQVLDTSHVAGRLFGSMFARIEGEDVDAFRIVGRSGIPAESALIANTYAQEYIEWTKEKSRESLAASRKFLQKQELKLAQEVESAQDSIKAFMQEEGAIALNQESQRLVQQIANLEVRRDEMQIQLEMQKARLDAELEELREIEPRLAEQLSSTLSAQLESIQKKRSEIELRLEEIQETNPDLSSDDDTPLGRELAKLKKRSRSLENRADSIASEFVTAAQSASGLPPSIDGEEAIDRLYDLRQSVASKQIEVTGLRAQMSSIEDRTDEYQRELQQIPEQSFELAQLEREKRLAEGMYSFVRERLQETRMNEESEVGYAEVLSPAGIPRGPVSPDVNRYLLLAALFGIGLGGAVVLVLEKMDTRIRRPDDLKEQGFSIMGAVPSMDAHIESNFGGQSKVTVDGRTVSTSLTMLLSPMSSSAETYRRIRSTLQFSRPDKDLRVISISSAGKGEGKTTTSLNLAIAIASAGKRTLIVDADLRRPRLHDMIDVPADTPRLSKLLFGDADFDPSALSSSIDNLSILPADTSIPNPAEILGSERMGDFVEKLRRHYDFVIFDTAPLLLFSDSISLSKKCDGTLLVAAAGETDIRAFTHAASMLDDVGVDLIGCILNRYDSGAIEYGYGYGYAYSYQRIDEYYGEGKSEGVVSDVAGRIRSWIKR